MVTFYPLTEKQPGLRQNQKPAEMANIPDGGSINCPTPHHATFAGPRSRLMALASLAIAACFRRTSSVSFTPARIASPWLKPDGQQPTPDLSLRAYRMHNRNPKAAAIYLRKHIILSRGASGK